MNKFTFYITPWGAFRLEDLIAESNKFERTPWRTAVNEELLQQAAQRLSQQRNESERKSAPDPKPGSMFWICARDAVETMRTAGMTKTQIACILCDIRAAAIQEEQSRMRVLFANNPPNVGIHWTVMEDELEAHVGREPL